MSSTSSQSTEASALGPFALNLRIFSIALFTLIAYLIIGLPLAVLPGYVHNQLGYSSVVAGLAISVQYVATLLSRSYAGRMADVVGSKQTVLLGTAVSAVSGLFLLLAYAFERTTAISLTAIILSRLALGLSESLIVTGALTWAIARLGPLRMAQVISWNGACTYGGLAAGAPLGVYLQSVWNIGALGVVGLLLGGLGFVLAWPRAAVPLVGGQRLAFKSVVWRVLPHGTILGLGSVGFGSLAAFVALYYASYSWDGAAHALSAFGVAFVAVRLLLSSTIARYGGFRVAKVSFQIEMFGLLVLWLAPSPEMAMLGAVLTGCGFSLIFPAIGVEAVARVPAASRGAAIGAYSAFFDVALALTGPIAGYISGQFGYSFIFLWASVMVLLSIIVVHALQQRT